MPSSPTSGSSKLGLVNPGDNIRSVIRTDRMTALQDMSRSQHMGEPFQPASNSSRIIGPGFVIHRNRRRRRGGGGAQDYPWKISLAVIEGSYNVKLRPGTINGVIPTNMFNTFGISQFGTWYVTLMVFTDGRLITSAIIQTENNPPPPPAASLNQAPLFFSVLLGVTVDAKVFQVVYDIIAANPQETIRTLRQEISPGEPYFDLNYTWEILATTTEP